MRMMAATAIQTEPVRLQIATSSSASARRLHDRLADAARMRQVAEPGTDGDPDGPEDPVERRPDCVAADVSGGADERQFAERTERDPPVTDLIAKHRKVPADAAHAQEERQRKGE